MIYAVVLNASYEIRSCLLLNDFMFSYCFHVLFDNFFVPRVDVNRGWVGVQYFNVKSTFSVAQWIWMAPLTVCLFPRKSRKSGLHCSCMNLSFHQHVNSYPFYSVLNEHYKEKTWWNCYNWIGIFSYVFVITFSERLLTILIRKRLLFLDIAITKYFVEIV